MKKISTIIANYNYGDYLISAIDSALNADFNGFTHKVIVVDDGSTDDSVEKVKKAFEFSSCWEKPDKTIYYGNGNTLEFICTDNKGASAARNTGINHCWNNSDFFHILDADDKISKTKLVKMMQKMESQEIGVVYADYYISREMYNKYEYKQPYDIARLREECIVHSGSLIRKNFLNMVKLPNGDIYDINLHGPASQEFIGSTEDYDLWLRLSKVCMFTHIPEPLTIVREHGRNQSCKMNDEIFVNNRKYMEQRGGK